MWKITRSHRHTRCCPSHPRFVIAQSTRESEIAG